MSSPPPPPLHYHVECAMCSGSLTLESDSLQEIFRLLKDHLATMQPMHETQPAAKQKMLGKAPHTNREIYDSKWFRWDITNVQPLDQIKIRVDKDIDAVLA